MQDVVRPELKREEYAQWQKIAKSLGYGHSGKGLWRLVRVMMAMAKESPAHYRKR